ncbi:MAG TPA: hypothetical protein VFV76_08395 [Actinomycetes bacterium]|nr:hypothetical protein [Actinomycetes bacterium]
MSTTLLAGGLGPLSRGAAETLYVAVLLSLVALAGSLLTVAAVRRRRAARARRGPAVVTPTVPAPGGKHARPAPPEAPMPAQPTRPHAPARHAARSTGRHRRPA